MPGQPPSAPEPALPNGSATGDEVAGAGSGFCRDRPTLLSYGALGAYAFWLYAFGPALALLRSELHLSYTLVGIYSALWAAGATGVGATFATASRRLGRRRLLWGSAAAATGGAALFAFTGRVSLTLLGAAVMGFAGTMVQNLTQSVLSERHGPRRDQALVESNIGAGACAVAAPLALGGLAATPAGWATAMVLPAVALLVLYLVYRHEALPALAAAPAGDRARQMPLAVWLLAALVAVCIAVEFCVIYFGAELLSTDGLSPTSAAAAMSGFYVGILVGRLAGGRLVRRPGRTRSLLWGSLALTTAGFVLFWLCASPVPALAGLLVAGIGVANLFPLSLALTLAAVPEQADAANGAAQLLGGLVVVIAPLALGALADQVGLRTAFATEPFLIAVSAALLLVGGLRSTRRPAGPQSG
ncbi:MAG: MFS transporter [Acidimicrobiales bacterium]